MQDILMTYTSYSWYTQVEKKNSTISYTIIAQDFDDEKSI